MQVDIYNIKGEIVGQKEIRDDVFAVPFNEAVVHQALVRQLANRRQGTVNTKTRGQVNKSGRKLFSQKHTGRARRGSAKDPLLKGGGVVFGPHPRSYRQDMPKKMRRLALRCVLSDKVSNERFKIIDKIDFDKPRTKEVFDLLVALGIDSSVLIVTVEANDNFIKSARNLTAVKTLPANLLNVADLLSCRTVIMDVDAVRIAEELWGQKAKEGAVDSI